MAKCFAYISKQLWDSLKHQSAVSRLIAKYKDKQLEMWNIIPDGGRPQSQRFDTSSSYNRSLDSSIRPSVRLSVTPSHFAGSLLANPRADCHEILCGGEDVQENYVCQNSNS